LKPKNESSIEELEEAVIKGEAEQTEWTKRTKLKLENFVQINWQECVNKIKNPHFTVCRELLTKTINDNEPFQEIYTKNAEAYAFERNTNKENGFLYLLEENTWILTLPLLYPNKQIYIVRVGNVADSTTVLFATFEYLRESTRLFFPYFYNQSFATISDFKIEYENKQNHGYFVDDKDLLKAVTSVKKEEDLSKNDLFKLLINERSEKEFLSNIISKMPGHVYWLNNKGIYMGCNDIQAKNLGLSSRNEIVGKTVFDLLSLKEAKKHNNINKLVMEKEEVYSGEEASMYNGFRTYLSYKTPLINNAEKNIGLLGISVDITDRKRAEELELKIKLQEKTKTLAEVAHDIRSPLASLSMLTEYFPNVSEKERVLLRNIAAKIEGIANRLLEKYQENNNANFITDETSEQYIGVHLGLWDILSNKKYQYKETEITFNYFPNPLYKFAFIKGDFSDFYRMISNLINNSVEAMEGKYGIIDIDFSVKEGKVEIRIKDNGKGMPKDITYKIMNDIEVASTKQKGYGIGIKQIKSTLKAMNAKMLINSIENTGTEITLIFPESKAPEWFTDKIVLHKGDILVVLDDDTSIYNVWQNRFHNYLKDIKIKYFTKGLETIDFINSIQEKDKIFLLADYELRNQEINGVDVIEKCNVQERSAVVTNAYISKIKDLNEKCKFIKILPKAYINDISLTVE
jgi:PAS domain S-box-containing protein